MPGLVGWVVGLELGFLFGTGGPTSVSGTAFYQERIRDANQGNLFLMLVRNEYFTHANAFSLFLSSHESRRCME